MSEPPHPEVVILNAALELRPEARAAFLDQACAGDAALRQRVGDLVKAHEQAGEFLEDPAHGAQRPANAAISPTLRLNLTTPGEKAGDRIGHYKLLQQIGEGGCGVVYMAEQEEPVRRRVALKVIKLGMDTKEVVARFEAERQALALMDHPNIAKVLEAGATDAGRPFFVMELVRGIQITDYCDENNLSTEARLDLFIKVSQAVQHAHQKGIIHRDLKPSNILVADHDGVPVPKVIDFGIAKATTDQRLTDKTLFTAFEQFIGTPAYMSPEQARMSGLDIDTRTDIYSLGVLLYELLTGKTPFDAQELLAAGLDEMRRTISEKEPARPSTRLSTMLEGELTTTAKHRHTDAPKLIHRLCGDLDWIVMKALEKDHARRYETANGLAADIQRHLKNEPVVARPPSNLYRFQKLVRRNKVAFIAAITVAGALVIGLVVSTRMFFNERQARHRAVAAEQEQSRLRREAEAESAESRRIATFVGNLANSLGPEGNAAKVESTYRVSLAMWMRLLGKEHQEINDALSSLAQVFEQGTLTRADTTAREAAQKCHATMAQFYKLTSDRKHHSEFRFIAVAYVSLGRVLEESGQISEAEKAYRDTLVLWRELEADSNLDEDRFDLGVNYERLGNVLKDSGQLAESLDFYRAAQGVWLKSVAELNQEDRRIHLAWTDAIIGQMLAKAGRFDEAAEAYRQALFVWKKLVAELNRNDQRNHVSETLVSLAATLQSAGKRSEAELLYREEESALREELATRKKGLGPGHPDVAATLHSLATILHDQGKSSEAESTIREALAIQRKQLGYGHPDAIRSATLLSEVLSTEGKNLELKSLLQEQLETETSTAELAQEQLGHLLWRQGDLHLKWNDFTNAQLTYEKAVQTFKQLQARFPETRFYRQEQAFSLRLLSYALQRANRLEAAEASLRAAWSIYSQLAKEVPNFPFYSQEASFTHGRLAEVLIAQGRLDEAQTMCRDELAANKKHFGNVHRQVDIALVSLATVLQLAGKPAEAEAAWREELAVERQLSGDGHEFVANSLAQLTFLLLVQEKYAEAVPFARECLNIRANKLPDDWCTFNARSMLGGALLGQKNYAEAEPLLLLGYEGMKQREDKIPQPGKLRQSEALQRLVQLYEETDRPIQAIEWKKKLTGFDQP